VQWELARKAHARPTFTDCAARYVAQCRGKRSIDVIKWHVTLLQSYIGDLEPQQIHDQTLEPFVKARLAGGRVRPRLIAVWRSCARSSIARSFPARVSRSVTGWSWPVRCLRRVENNVRNCGGAGVRCCEAIDRTRP
jgi:hypothetical protein